MIILNIKPINFEFWETVSSFGFDESDEILSLLKQKASHIFWKLSMTESEVGDGVLEYINLQVPVEQADVAVELYDLIMDGGDPSEYSIQNNKSEKYSQIIEIIDDKMILVKSVEDFIVALKQVDKILNNFGTDLNIIDSYTRLYNCLLKLNSLSGCLPSGHPYLNIDISSSLNNMQIKFSEEPLYEILDKVSDIINQCIYCTYEAEENNFPEMWSSIVWEWECIFDTEQLEELMKEIRYLIFSEYIKMGYRLVK